MPSLPMKDDSGELIGPMMLSQGSFDDCRTRHKLAGIRGLVVLRLSNCHRLCVIGCVFQLINISIFLKLFIE